MIFQKFESQRRVVHAFRVDIRLYTRDVKESKYTKTPKHGPSSHPLRTTTTPKLPRGNLPQTRSRCAAHLFTPNYFCKTTNKINKRISTHPAQYAQS